MDAADAAMRDPAMRDPYNRRELTEKDSGMKKGDQSKTRADYEGHKDKDAKEDKKEREKYDKKHKGSGARKGDQSKSKADFEEALNLEVIDDEELSPKPFLSEWSNDSFAASNPSGENMNRFQANDLRNLVAEVVSAYQAEKRNKWLLESPEVIEEGVFDPGILKAVFTAGGPGSGKSFTADLIFGMRDASGKPLFQNASFCGTNWSQICKL